MWCLPYKIHPKFQYCKSKKVLKGISNKELLKKPFHPLFEKGKFKGIMLFDKEHIEFNTLKTIPTYKIFSRGGKLLYSQNKNPKISNELKNKGFHFYEALLFKDKEVISKKEYSSFKNIFQVNINKAIGTVDEKEIYYKEIGHITKSEDIYLMNLYLLPIVLHRMGLDNTSYILSYKYHLRYYFMLFIIKRNKVLWIPNLQDIAMSGVHVTYLNYIFNLSGLKDQFEIFEEEKIKRIDEIIILHKQEIKTIKTILEEEKDMYITSPIVELTLSQFYYLIEGLGHKELLYSISQTTKPPFQLTQKEKQAKVGFLNLKIAGPLQKDFETYYIDTINLEDIIKVENHNGDINDDLKETQISRCSNLSGKYDIENVSKHIDYVLNEQESEKIYRYNYLFNVAWLSRRHREKGFIVEDLSSYLIVSYTDPNTYIGQQHIVDYNTIQNITTLKELLPYLKYPIFEHIFMKYDKSKEIKGQKIKNKKCNILDHCYFCFTNKGLKVFKLSINISKIAYLFDTNKSSSIVPVNGLNLKQKIILGKGLILNFDNYLWYELNSLKEVDKHNIIPYLSNVVPSGFFPRIDGFPINGVDNQCLDFDPNGNMIYTNIMNNIWIGIDKEDHHSLIIKSNRKELSKKIGGSFLHSSNIQAFLEAHKDLIFKGKINRNESKIGYMREHIKQQFVKISNKEYLTAYLRPSPYLTGMFKENVLSNTISVLEYQGIKPHTLEAHINRKGKIGHTYMLIDDAIKTGFKLKTT